MTSCARARGACQTAARARTAAMPHAVSARKVRSVPNTSLAILALVGILHGRQASAHRDAISESSLTVRCWAGSDNILISIRTDFKTSAATLLKTAGLILSRAVPLGE